MNKIFAKYGFRLGAAVVTFAIGLGLVWFFTFRDECTGYPVEPIKTIPVPLTEKLDPTSLAEPVLYEPLHIPRLKNTRLAIPGTWMSTEEPTEGYEDWLGLYKTKDGYETRKVRAKIGVDYAGEDDPYYGREFRAVLTTGKEKPFFIVKGIPALKTGGVVSSPVEFDEDGHWGWGWYAARKACEQQIIKIGSAAFLIYAQEPSVYGSGANETAMATANEGECYGGMTMITDGLSKQVLSDPYIERDFRNSFIVWSGDIDGDNRPDLILNLGTQGPRNYRYNFVLYLSSQAKAGEITAPVAKFEVWQ